MKDDLMYKSPMRNRFGKIYSLLLIVLLLSATFFIRKVKADDGIPLVIINGDTISSIDMDQQVMQLHTKLSPEDRRDFDYSKLLNKLVNDKLIIQEALAMGMDTDEEIVKHVREVQIREARKIYARQIFSYNPDISEKEISDYFERNYFKVKLRTLATRDCDEVEKYAEMIRNGSAMDSLAKEVSLDSRRYLGGAQSLRYWFTLDNQTRQLVENLEVGGISTPFPYNEACMIIRLDERVSADTSELPLLIDGIKKSIDKERRTEAWAKLMDSLYSEYSLKIDSTVLNDIQNDSAMVFRGEFSSNGTDRPIISGVEIDGFTENEIRSKISHKAMGASDKSFREIMDMTITEISELMVLNAAAEANGITNNPKVQKLMQHTMDSTMIEYYLQENVLSNITFNHEQFQEYYNTNPDLFREESEIRLYDLQVADEETAKLAMTRLKEGADFRYVSKEFGVTDGVAHDADQWMKADAYPEQITSQLDSLVPGEYTNPLRIATGWVIFKVRDRRPGRLKTLEEVDLQIREIMFNREFKQLLDEVLGLLKENSEIIYFDDNINAYFGAGSDS